MFEAIVVIIAVLIIYFVYKKLTWKPYANGGAFLNESNLLTDNEKTNLVLEFEQEMKDGGLKFLGEDYCKFHKINLDKKRYEAKNNPGILDK